MNLMDAIDEQGSFRRGLEDLFMQRIVQDGYREFESRADEIHNSDWIYKCSRRSVFRKVIPVPMMDKDGAMRTWFGRQVHKTPILEHHELSLEWNGIYGTVDEYEDGFLVDKKTTRNMPERIRSHHKKQLEGYTVLLDENGHPVMQAAILYIDVVNLRVKASTANLNRGYDSIKAEMIDGKEEILAGLRGAVLPSRRRTWLCGFCEWHQLCHLEDETIIRILNTFRERT